MQCQQQTLCSTAGISTMMWHVPGHFLFWKTCPLVQPVVVLNESQSMFHTPLSATPPSKISFTKASLSDVLSPLPSSLATVQTFSLLYPGPSPTIFSPKLYYLIPPLIPSHHSLQYQRPLLPTLSVYKPEFFNIYTTVAKIPGKSPMDDGLTHLG